MEELKSRVMTKIFMVKALMEKVPPTEILPGIYLSGIVSALNPQVLSEYKIQHIVNCSTADNAFEHGYMQGLDAYAPKNQLEAPSTPPPKYIRIDILDQPYVDIATHFDPLFQQLSRTDGPILFHCVAGVSRSTTLLISYLVRRGYTLDAAYSLIKVKRPKIRPNPGFMKQLLQDYLSFRQDGCEEFKKIL